MGMCCDCGRNTFPGFPRCHECQKRYDAEMYRIQAEIEKERQIAELQFMRFTNDNPWKCDFCDNYFPDRDTCERHEIRCPMRPRY